MKSCLVHPPSPHPSRKDEQESLPASLFISTSSISSFSLIFLLVLFIHTPHFDSWACDRLFPCVHLPEVPHPHRSSPPSKSTSSNSPSALFITTSIHECVGLPIQPAVSISLPRPLSNKRTTQIENEVPRRLSLSQSKRATQPLSLSLEL